MTEDFAYHTEGVAELVASMFPAGYKGTCVDVGAYAARWLSNSYILEEAGWTVYCIEPNPRCAPFLASRANVYCFAMGSESKEDVDFYIHTNELMTPGGMAGATGLFPHVIEGYVVEAIKVSMRTLDWFMETHFDGDSLDFLSIDTELSDLDVLRGIDLDRWNVGVVCIENLNKDQQQYDYMKDHGYRFCQTLVFNDIYQRCRA